MPNVCKKVVCLFFSKEKATMKPIFSFDRVYQKKSKDLGVSYTSVHRIMNGKRPCKSNRPKERAKIWTTLIFVLLKEQSTVYIHGQLLRPSQ
jgi:hypothetical protein